MIFASLLHVALLAEGVDRNFILELSCFHSLVSPSSRRAWIEISYVTDTCWPQKVALLAEGVDRNLHHPAEVLSAKVALLAEGVDRNMRSKKN